MEGRSAAVNTGKSFGIVWLELAGAFIVCSSHLFTLNILF